MIKRRKRAASPPPARPAKRSNSGSARSAGAANGVLPSKQQDLSRQPTPRRGAGGTASMAAVAAVAGPMASGPHGMLELQQQQQQQQQPSDVRLAVPDIHDVDDDDNTPMPVGISADEANLFQVGGWVGGWWRGEY